MDNRNKIKNLDDDIQKLKRIRMRMTKFSKSDTKRILDQD
ncbi:8871_t:CDS:2 [Cetraspora pellucida]|uniref:8871_t:CDS:1 n=1 Tax=Cetraspora pellucida TaxID=1433469 RepID=A0A9N9ACC5_9GLOM|nr:8871_t:CDS:2 [Cetraspora pellucida]